MLPGLQDFTLEVYGYDNSIGTINMYTSQDGNTWQEQAYRTSPAVNTKMAGLNKIYRHQRVELMKMLIILKLRFVIIQLKYGHHNLLDLMLR